MKKYGIYFFFLMLSFHSCKKEVNNKSSIANNYSSIFLLKYIDLHLNMIKSSAGYTPPVASRTIGYTYIALYEALQSGMYNHYSLKNKLNINTPFPEFPDKDIYYPGIAVGTLKMMLEYLFPYTPQYNLDSLNNYFMSDSLSFLLHTDPETLSRSIDYGKSIATVIYEWSKTDGGHNAFLRNYPSDYIPPLGDSLWVPTPSIDQPAFHYKSAMQPYWGNNIPFITANSNIINPPPSFSTDTSSYFYKANYAVYYQVLHNTPSQIEIAKFWSDDIGTYSPPGHSLAITRILINDHDTKLGDASIILSKIGIAVNDAFINCFKNKYIYNLIRPISYIQRYIDNSWNTIIGTPPFPEYASCHSTQSGAAAYILEKYYGTSTSFTDNSKSDINYSPRHFNKIFDFAEEAAISRFYGGVHYQFSCTLGVEVGRNIGKNVYELY